MLFAVAIGVLSAIVILIAMSRLNIKKFMGYPATMDVLVTVVLIWMLHGSYVGMVAAVIGGLFFSGMITVIRRYYGYSQLERRGMRLVWIDYPGKWHGVTTGLFTNQSGETLCWNLKSLKRWQLFTVAGLVLLCVL